MKVILNLNEGPLEVETHELDFTNIMCDLEDNGVDVMGLLDDEQSMKVFSTMRAIVGVITGTKDLKLAGRMLTEHLKNKGKIEDIMKIFTELMKSAGFGKAEEETENEVKTAEIAVLPAATTMN